MQITHDPLPNQIQKSLTEWLAKDEFDTLLSVLKSKSFVLECEAIQSRSQSSKYPLEGGVASDTAKEADVINAAINCLTDLRVNTDPFTIATAKP